MDRGGGTKAPFTGCSFVKRDEKLLESKLPIVPYGAGAQTSFREQSKDRLGLRLLLYENRPEPKHEPKHKIFLSHSGAQKSFVKQLCKDIERYDRYPFFDLRRTSLSIGCDFPKEIFEAIEQCQVAVVVLSEDFFSRTKWPMSELSALVKRKSRDPGLIIMPIFLGLTQVQCREKENRDRWFSLWQRWAKDDKRIILEEWMAVFKVFGYINSVSLCGLDEVKCREDIVDAVCKEVPPETRCDDSHVQGRLRLCKTIDEKIGGMQLSKCYKVRILGLYGVGGIGKSTACMTLCNHYFEEFHGRVCHVEFGDRDELHMLQEILRRLTDTTIEQIDKLNVHECKHRLNNIKNQKILLAMDNVSESYEIVEQAKLILRARFAKSSIVIVTARSLGELQNLNIEESECMEMPELTMDDATSLFVREVACDQSIDKDLIQLCVDRCYFRKGNGTNFHYHPLALRVLGGQLGSDPSQWCEKLEEMDVFNQYQETPDKHPIFSILRRSFDVLNNEDKVLFVDVALFAKSRVNPLPLKYGMHHWLSMIHGKSIKSRLNALKRKSLIEDLEEKNMVIGIHDLWREFCVMETKIGELKSRCWIYEHWSGSNDPTTGEPSFYTSIWKRAERISLNGVQGKTCNVTLNLSRCSNLIALDLFVIKIEGNALDLSGVCNLKSLRVAGTNSQFKVHGLGLLRHLCLLSWSAFLPVNMDFLEEIGSLTNLQILDLVDRFGHNKKVPNLSNLSLLQYVAFYQLFEGNSMTCTSTMTNLQHLSIQNCKSLQRCNGVGDLVALEELKISWCEKLEELPNLQALKNLKKLDISKCTSIQTLVGVGDLVTLLELQAYRCTNLGELPDLSKLTNLQVLDLERCLRMKVVMGLNVLISLQKCTISINGIGEFTDLHKLTKLQSIRVEGWSPQGSSIVDSLVNLEHLSIFDCKGVDIFDGPSKVSRLCKIDIRDCEFKDVACLSNFIGLSEVSISDCVLLERFPDMHKATGLESLRISNCKNLQVWEGLDRTRAISSEAIGVHLKSSGTFPNLQHLTLYELAITELPDLSDFPQLSRLCIHNCPSLVRLTSSVPLTRLKHLDIFNCKSLTTIPNLKWLQTSQICESDESCSEVEYM